MHKLKRGLKLFFYSLGIILLLANVFILLTGRTYMYRAVYYTYLHGQAGPGIFDKDYFYSRTLAKSNHPVPWPQSVQKNRKKLSARLTAELEKYRTTGFLVIQNDSVLYERYWDDADEQTVSNSFSMAKSVVSLLTGIAIQEGKIKSLDQPVKELLPWIKEEAGVVTIRHLVTMSSGMDWGESGGNPLSDNAKAYYGTDLTDHMHEISFTMKPGEVFDYRSGNTELLGIILTQVTGQSLGRYAEEKLWKPLGSENDAYWSLDHENGMEKAYCCIYASLRDFARLGKLMMHNGVCNGKRIVDSAYVAESVVPAPLKDTDGRQNTRYGLGWWMVKHKGVYAYYMRGILGQYVICIPEKHIIVARAGHKRGEKRDDQPLDLLNYIEAGLELADR